MGVKPARSYVDDRPGEGVFRVHRDVYADPELFELEIKYIFERTRTHSNGDRCLLSLKRGQRGIHGKAHRHRA